MAIILAGKTRCTACGEPIDAANDAVAFPAFLPASHRLAFLNDAAFHHACFASYEHRAEMNRLYQRYREIWDSRPRDLKSIAQIEAWGKNAFAEFLEPAGSDSDE